MNAGMGWLVNFGAADLDLKLLAIFAIIVIFTGNVPFS